MAAAVPLPGNPPAGRRQPLISVSGDLPTVVEIPVEEHAEEDEEMEELEEVGEPGSGVGAFLAPLRKNWFKKLTSVLQGREKFRLMFTLESFCRCIQDHV